MNARDLVLAALSGDDLAVRQWVKDARRVELDLGALDEPIDLQGDARVVASALVELLAERWGKQAPAWARGGGKAEHPVYLVQRASSSPAVRRECEKSSPAPLRRRNVFALPDYLRTA
ncbi:MAG: hypothetical protein HY898_12445 [Deltaproteobacteria bacterium]|nr:hypothetical protein [Deltaproteobacteria bacterium]